MQRVSLICVGKLKEKFYIDATAEYRKRLQRHCKFDLIELPEVRLGDNPSPAEIHRALAAEAASGEEEVLLSEADAAAVGAEVVEKANAALAAAGKTAQLKLAGEARAIAGGLILRAGDIETNCSIDALLSLNREALAAQVAGILF